VSVHHPLIDERPVWASSWGHDLFGTWATFALGKVIQRMRWISPGRFLMGAPENELGRGNSEGPQHEVRLSAGYWLFDTPVTYALWNAVHGNGDIFEYPVVSVSWNDAKQFIERINARLPELDLFLPTEAQWEYACRAGTTTPTYATETESLSDIAWFNGNSKRTQPVARKRCNAWGLYDMLGNVWEWCADDLREYGVNAVVDPVGPSDSARRVLRGGSWVQFAHIARAAHRYSLNCDRQVSNVGFRCARTGS
jgi:formylglycine-generating enzyme required for sulfatase activity